MSLGHAGLNETDVDREVRIFQPLEVLEQIEHAINKMKVPASFADQFYDLRMNIDFVRARLTQVSQGTQGA